MILKTFPTERFGESANYSGYNVDAWPARNDQQIKEAEIKHLQAKSMQAKKDIVKL